MNSSMTILLAYIGPDQMLPVASAFAAALGVILMFWRYMLSLITKPFRLLFRRADVKQATAAATPVAPVVPVAPEAQK